MKEIFTSIFFLAIAGGLLWGWLHLQDTAKQTDDTRPSIASATMNVPAVTVKSEEKTVEINKKKDEEVKPVVASTIASDKLDIKVFNGGAPKGSAAKVQTFLKTAGYTKAEAVSAAGDYTGVTVYYRDGKMADAEAVKKALLKDYPTAQIKASTSPKSEDGSADVVVMLGK